MHAKIGADLGFVVLINIIYWHGSNGLTISKLTLATRRQLATGGEEGGLNFFLAIDVSKYMSLIKKN